MVSVRLYLGSTHHPVTVANKGLIGIPSKTCNDNAVGDFSWVGGRSNFTIFCKRISCMQVMKVIGKSITRQKLRGNLSVSSGSLEFEHLALQAAGDRRCPSDKTYRTRTYIWVLFVPTCYPLPVNAMGGICEDSYSSQFEKKTFEIGSS